MLGGRGAQLPRVRFREVHPPPTNLSNAMLSLGYTLLTRRWLTVLSEWASITISASITSRASAGRRSLSISWPFRPILADASVIQVVNNGEVKADAFVVAGPAVSLKPYARRVFIPAYTSAASAGGHPLPF